MAPWIRDGDEIDIGFAQPQEFRRGDLIVYRRAGVFICHRLMRRIPGEGGAWFSLKADVSWQCDPPVAADDCLGVVVALRRSARDLPLNTRVMRLCGLLAGICVPCLVSVLQRMRSLTS